MLMKIDANEHGFFLEYPDLYKKPELQVNLIVTSVKEATSEEMTPYQLKLLDIIKFGRLGFLVKNMSTEAKLEEDRRSRGAGANFRHSIIKKDANVDQFDESKEILWSSNLNSNSEIHIINS